MSKTTARNPIASPSAMEREPALLSPDVSICVRRRHLRHRAREDSLGVVTDSRPPDAVPAGTARSVAARAYGAPVHERGRLDEEHAWDRRGAAGAAGGGNAAGVHQPLRDGLGPAARHAAAEARRLVPGVDGFFRHHAISRLGAGAALHALGASPRPADRLRADVGTAAVL